LCWEKIYLGKRNIRDIMRRACADICIYPAWLYGNRINAAQLLTLGHFLLGRDFMQLDALWAKSQRQDMVSFMPLRAHLIDVGAAAEEMYRRQSEIRRSILIEAFGLDDYDTCRVVGYLAALHDIGKATPWFQAKWETGHDSALRGGFCFPRGLHSSVASSIRHEVYSHAIVSQILTSVNIDANHIDLILDAIVFHHGRYPSQRALFDARQALGQLSQNQPEWALPP
jgi:CRISPR-associated endonuclease/helicase Cas3